MNKLIIESGASKSDWLFFNNQEELLLQSEGYNPCSDPIQNKGLIIPEGFNNTHDIQDIYFYGAGVNSSKIVQELTEELKQLFPNQKRIEIYDDMIACGRALSDGRISVISILGTGCNSALFDGEKIVKTVPSLGYLFNESGSGFSIGAEVIKSFFYGYMPESDREKFIKAYGDDLGQVLGLIYQSDKPNSTISKFAEFLIDTKPEYKDYILEKIFSSFIEEKVKRIQRDNNFKLNFVGSIAYHYQDVLSMVCRMHGYEVDKILKSPITELKNYHLKHAE